MAKLYFYYSAMNAGKSTLLLQSNYNYQERGMNTLIFTPTIDDRYQSGYVCSRIGLKSPAVGFEPKTDLFTLTQTQHEKTPLHCVFVDEAHFLTKEQVYALTEVVDRLKIPVLTYGLRSDFRAEPFEGSTYLLIWADELSEVKTICHCAKKASYVIRVDEKGQVVKSGAQVEIGGNDQYISLCRKHYKDALK